MPVGKWEQAEPGVRRKIYPPGKHLMMMEVQFEAGAVGSEHSHPHEQYTYCLEGKFEFKVDGKTVMLTPGETLHIPGNAVHGVKALQDGTLLDTFTPVREDLL